MADSLKWYRRLLKFYPARFREEYEAPLERDFADELREAGSPARFWVRALADLAISIPREFAREMLEDLRFSVRVYAKRPVVTLLAIGALAMAIGATTGVFSVVDALLLRSLPFRDPQRVVTWSQMGFLRDDYKAWRANQNYADAIAPYLVINATLARSDAAVRIKLTETDAAFFSTLGSDTELGRSFRPEESAAGHNKVAVISYALWQQFFGGDPRVLGSKMSINGAAVEIIGVARPKMDFPDRTAVWTSTIHDFLAIPKTGVFFWHAIARLKPEMTLARANSMMQAELWTGQAPDQELPRLVSLRNTLSGNVTQASLIMMGAAAFVLLIACANIANLLLARVAERRSEMAVRAALGASRARLTQQLITESIALAAIASIAGIFIAQWTSRLALAAQPVPLGSQEYTIVDWRVIAFAVLITAFTGILFGVFPAYLIGRMQPASGGLGERSGKSGVAMARLRGAMVAVQVSLTLVMLSGSIVLGRGFLRLMGADLGFRVDHLVTLSASTMGTRENETANRGNYWNETLRRLRAVPGVDSAAVVDSLPLMADYFSPTGIFGETNVKLDSGGVVPMVNYGWASPEYFKTIGARIVAGRDLTDADKPGSEPAAVVTESFARSTGLGNSVLGRKFTAAFFKQTYTIVGIATDIQFMATDDVRRPMAYLAESQAPPRTMTFVARVHGDPEKYLAVGRDAVQAVDNQVALFNVMTLENRLADTLARPRFYTTAVLFLSGFALLLAILGIYGVASYSVAQRTHEIGVRLAVGARAAEVRWMIVLQGLAPAAVGMALGMAGAASVGKFLEHMVEGAKSMDAFTYAAAASGMALIATVSTWTATRRVARMDPVVILRSE